MRETVLVLLFFWAFAFQAEAQVSVHPTRWTGTWATAVEYAGKGDMPHTNLAHHSLRQTIHLSIGGDSVRIQLSNEFGNAPVDIESVYIALPSDSSTIVASTSRYLLFNGRRHVTIPAGKAIYSDVMRYKLKPLQQLSLTICYGRNVPTYATSHRGSRTTSFIAEGRVLPKEKYIVAEKVEHWYNIAKVEVRSTAPCIAVIGNSITDGRGSTTDAQDRWTDRLAEHLDGKVGVLNLGIGGNAVRYGGLSEPAVKRFDRDILGQHGVTHLIIFEGTNDIGSSNHNYEQLAQGLIEAYKEMIVKANKAGCKVYMGTIPPTMGHSYFSWWHEAVRQQLNQWMLERPEGVVGTLDFDAVLRDPNCNQRLLPEIQTDFLHPNPEGYKRMGEYAARFLSEHLNIQL